MQMNTAVKRLFSCDLSDILAALPGPSDPVWDTFRRRQRAFQLHGHTRSIAVKWCELASTKAIPDVVEPLYVPPPLREAANRCGKRFEDYYAGTAVTLLLTELAPGEDVPMHRDAGPVLTQCHRCHIPIVTDPNVQFIVDDEVFHLEAGQAYEFDNMRRHGVKNRSNAPRVHLICNVIPSGGLQTSAA
jgi:hypothetical protein